MLTITPDSCFAHRGLHDETRPRNSLSAIVAAGDVGYGVEFDIQCSSDGVLMVSHDDNTLADTGVALPIGATHSRHLRELRFTGTDERLATLDEVLAAVSPTVPLLVEVKPTRRVREVATIVLERLRGRESSTALQSFQPSVVSAIRGRGFAVGQLVEDANPGMPMPERFFWRTIASNAWTRPDFLAAYLTALERPGVRFWRERLRCPVLGWTVVDDAGIATCRAARAGLIFEQVRP